MMISWNLIFMKICFLQVIVESHGFIDGLYCGKDNCYEVLGISRQASRNEISKAYRLLARKYHPDVHKTDLEKEKAVESFRKIANAYEILKDEESRNDYDFMLDHPEHVYSHYYRYYRRRMTPKVDVKIVISVFLIIVSICQYYVARQRYDSAIKYLVTTPKYRIQALETAKMNGLLNEKKKSKNKAEAKEETENIIRKVLEENIDIRGGYAKPKITDILLCRLFVWPFYLMQYVAWYVKWIWRFNIRKEPYGEVEKLYLIRKNMNVKDAAFEQFTDVQKKEFLRQELWIYENYKKWQEKKDEETKKLMAENGRYKAYRRYMKQHGPGRLTFDDS